MNISKSVLSLLSIFILSILSYGQSSIDYKELSKEEYGFSQSMDMEVLSLIVEEFGKEDVIKDHIKSVKRAINLNETTVIGDDNYYAKCGSSIRSVITYEKFYEDTKKGIAEDKRKMQSASTPKMREIYRQRYNNGINRLEDYRIKVIEYDDEAKSCEIKVNREIENLKTSLDKTGNEIVDFYKKYKTFGKSEKARKKEREEQDNFNWIEAKDDNTIASYNEYLNNTSNKLHREEAKEKLEFVTPIKTFKDIAKFINKNPQKGYYNARISVYGDSFTMSKRFNSKKYYTARRIYSSQISNIKSAEKSKYDENVVKIYGYDVFKSEIKYRKNKKSKKTKTKIDDKFYKYFSLYLKDKETVNKVIEDLNNIIKN